ncbi:RDD family protein [Vibrio lamellibrachiae]|uniref:RDD family protein n=1 Tax=Vibrio lamellibrachiae TaxID=2910253 RepID=UPI003D1161E1
MKYVGFGKRLIASTIDGIVLLPFMFLFEYANDTSYYYALYLALPYGLMYSLYRFYCHGKYGATIGKRIVKIRVVNDYDELPISYREAGKRVLIDTLFSILIALATISALLTVSPEVYELLTWEERNALYQSSEIGWYGPTMMVMVIWSVLNGLSLLVTDKNRALHDFVAGTVVIRRK